MTPEDRPRPEYGEPVGPEDLFFSPGDAELDPKTIATALIANEPLFAHLRDGDATLLFLMRVMPKDKGGKSVLGELCLPSFGGALAGVGKWMLARMCDGLPDFIMVLDVAWWEQAALEQRQALVFHELLHAKHATDKDGELRFTPEGLVVWALQPHDIEEFGDVVRRFGAWNPDLLRFTQALRDGGVL